MEDRDKTATAEPQTAAGVPVELKRLVSNQYCFGCSKKRPCKVTGTYGYEGETHNIYECPRCRATTTKRKKRGLPC